MASRRRTRAARPSCRPRNWPLSAEEEEWFWSLTELATTRAYARACIASPWGVFGTTLCRAIAFVPPHVVLPPLGKQGGPGSLNILVNLVADSGDGKGEATSTGRLLLPFPVPVSFPDSDGVIAYPGDLEEKPVGTGEGIPHAYGKGGESGVTRHHWRVFYDAPEIDTLDAIANRQGSMIFSELKKVAMGEGIGAQNADSKKRVPIDRHTYRFTMLMGVQPTKAQRILDDEDGGTPQRFLWFPCFDWDAPDELPDVGPPLLEINWPGKDDSPYRGPNEDPQSPPLQYIKVCETARREQIAERQLVNRTRKGEHRAHALFLREKIAAGISIIRADGCRITDDDWARAEMAQRISDWQLAEVEKETREKSRKENIKKGAAEGARAAVSEDSKHTHKVNRVRANIVLKLKELGPMNRSDLRQQMAYRDRLPGEPYFDEALEKALEAGEVVGDDEEYSLP